ncbi:MAG: DUF3087 family protein [Oleispira sp.]|nr:DUF3087 family protein [Oleispira sp.]
MKLQTIDKALYRKRLNILIVSSIIILLVASLSVSNILITLFSAELDDNFWLNVAGVVAGIAALGLMFKILAGNPFMAEVNYVWTLKKELNRIYRNTKKVERGVEDNNKIALIISYFNLQGSKQVYELDNNTLTLDELKQRIEKLDEQIAKLGLDISADDYSLALLERLD